MAANERHTAHELVVASDGSIPADQLARLGVGPGAHLRVVQTPATGDSFAGSLPNLPDLTWEDFEKASAQRAEELRRDRRPSLATFRADVSIAKAADEESPADRPFRTT